jgi:hypothetical protein
MSVWPAMVAVVIALPPRKGTWTMLKPPARCISVMVRWERLPLPTVP